MTNDFSTMQQDPPLRRSNAGRMIAGVASGVADYLDVDVTAVRLGVVALTLLGGAGIPLYAAAWFLLPDEESGESIAQQVLHHGRLA